MATYHPSITDEQAALIRGAALFFVASADPQLSGGPNDVGPVNVSPKGGVPLHILDRNRVAYLDYRGSGNETARHCAAGGPVTVMVCSFDEDAAIVRLFGRARVTPLSESPLAPRLLEHPAAELKGSPRFRQAQARSKKARLPSGPTGRDEILSAISAISAL